MSKPQPSQANHNAAMWLVFVVVVLACDAGIAAILNITLQTPPLLAVLSAAPVAIFVAAMFAFVKPLRQAALDIVAQLPSWLFLSR